MNPLLLDMGCALKCFSRKVLGVLIPQEGMLRFFQLSLNYKDFLLRSFQLCMNIDVMEN
jgi:hypothetical protein